MCDIIGLQTKYCIKEGRKGLLKSCIDSCTVFEHNEDVDSIVTKLFKNPLSDKMEILKLQHNMYAGIMKIEIDTLNAEMANINQRIAHKRKWLRSLVNDELFKCCNDLIDYKKFEDNTKLWLKSLADKIEYDKFVDKWKTIITSIKQNHGDAGMVLSRNVNIDQLSISSVIYYSFEPSSDGQLDDSFDHLDFSEILEGVNGSPKVVKDISIVTAVDLLSSPNGGTSSALPNGDVSNETLNDGQFDREIAGEHITSESEDNRKSALCENRVPFNDLKDFRGRGRGRGRGGRPNHRLRTKDFHSPSDTYHEPRRDIRQRYVNVKQERFRIYRGRDHYREPVHYREPDRNRNYDQHDRKRKRYNDVK